MIEKLKTVAIVIMCVAIIVLVYSIQHQQQIHSKQIIELNAKLGISQSNLIAADDLAKKYRSELDSLPPPVVKIIKEEKLVLRSRDSSVFQVDGVATTGTVQTTSKKDAIEYVWTDNLHRFHLVDSNIYVPGDELFTYTQNFRLKGLVFKNADGTVQLRKVELREVHRDKSGAITEIPDSKSTLIDSQFEYESDQITKNINDIWHPKLIAGASVGQELQPKFLVGAELVNVGHFLDYANIGANIQVKPDWEATELGIGLSYNLLKPLLDTNLSLGISVSTPSNNLANQWNMYVDAIFYLTN